MLVEVLGFVNLLGAGVLAGEEFVICYGGFAVKAAIGRKGPPQPTRFERISAT